MLKISTKEQKFLEILLQNESVSSSSLYAKFTETGEDISLVTVKRILSLMVKKGFVVISGSGRSTVYNISASGRVFSIVDAKKYCESEPDSRYGMDGFNFELLLNLPEDIFTDQELEKLKTATLEYKSRIK